MEQHRDGRPELAHRDLDGVDRRPPEHGVGDAAGESLEQQVVALGDDLLDGHRHGAVVDGLLEAVALGGAGQVDLHHEVDLDRLRRGPLVVEDADGRHQTEAAYLDPISHVVVLRRDLHRAFCGKSEAARQLAPILSVAPKCIDTFRHR